jgi:RNA polymerase sigma factor (sigma-70 family)
MRVMRRTMSRNSEGWLPTRRSMLERLKNWDDHDSWREFFDSYWRPIYGVALRYGLTDSEAEEVVQETVLSIAKKMDTFKYDPAVCSFKSWLLRMTQLRILDQLRKRGPRDRQMVHHGHDTSGTSALERIADPAPFPLEAVWDEEWERNLVEAAMERIKGQVSPLHYQLYYLHVVKELPARQVASMLAVATAQVYLVKHRLAGLVKREIQRLEASELVRSP